MQSRKAAALYKLLPPDRCTARCKCAKLALFAEAGRDKLKVQQAAHAVRRQIGEIPS